MKKTKLRIVDPIPTRGIPDPWSIAIHLADQPMLPLPGLSPIMHLRLNMDEAEWRTALYWVAKKKWLPRLQFSGSQKYFRLYEPWGDLLLRTLELCDRCYDGPETCRYSSAANWFLQIVQEAKRIGQQAILANEDVGKTQFVKERYEITAALKDGKNPVNFQTSPHFYRLMDAALRLERFDDFNDLFWKPFLRACCRWTRLTDSKKCQEFYVEQDKILSRCGRGRGKIVVFSSL